MIIFETEVRIERPIEEVYAYVSDPLNFPRWSSAVQEVRENVRGKTYSMERRLPSGRAVNELEILALDRPREFAIRTISGPTLSSTAICSLRRETARSSSSTRRSSCMAPPPSCRSSRGEPSRVEWTRTSRR